MAKFIRKVPPEWDLGDWERVLNINVGTVYVCRECENIVIVTRGGVGMLELTCCGKPMEKVEPHPGQRGTPT